MKPILFNTEMVRAILEGRKTVTRRILKPQPTDCLIYEEMGKYYCSDFVERHEIKPPCRPGDILYVRETWAQPAKHMFRYRADSPVQNLLWQPSIHMPKAAARIFLRVTEVRAERLKEICGRGLVDEGLFSFDELRNGMMREKFSAFKNLWDSTIKPADLNIYGWDADPLVWVIEFERISKEAAQCD